MNARYARFTGLVVGFSVGQWIGRAVRERVANAAPPGLIDWGRAREIAINFSGGVRLVAEERERAREQYRHFVEELVPAVAEFIGVPAPEGVSRLYVFDRIDWIDANLESFAEILRPLEALIHLPDHPLARMGALLWTYLGRSAATVEIGMALGFLSRRVLGQYDIAVLGREPVSTGKLYFVEPNVRWVVRAWQLPELDFRRWLVLHEVTHAFEFETNDWLRDYVNGLIRQWVESLRRDVSVGRRIVEAVRAAARGQLRDELSWIELLMTGEQREIFRSLQAVMAVIEGYSNYVMRAVGRTQLPSYDVIERRLEERERMRTPVEQLVLRLTGLDIKLEQYRRGEAFCRAVVERYGAEGLRSLWSSPSAFPRYEELGDPDAWYRRVAGSVGTG
ncbi:MAG: zinc-dependent metalloprotease [Thermomicrobium sp.]|nr:zinc-dependent metalloprotease [Thermomicrobium sp.]